MLARVNRSSSLSETRKHSKISFRFEDNEGHLERPQFSPFDPAANRITTHAALRSNFLHRVPLLIRIQDLSPDVNSSSLAGRFEKPLSIIQADARRGIPHYADPFRNAAMHPPRMWYSFLLSVSDILPMAN
jgi:hypothetical protein